MRTRLIAVIVLIIVAALAIWAITGVKTKKSVVSKVEPQEEAEVVNLSKILNQANQLEAQGNLQEAKSSYKKLVSEFSNSPLVGNWQKKIWDLNIKLLFSPAITSESVSYEIKPGDSLVKIAKKFNTTAELLRKSNGLTSDTIIAGRKLKVWTKPFSIVVDKSQNILMLKTDDEVFKTYVVSTGENNSTPVGTFGIVNKLVDPTWFKAGAVVPPESPDNILGSRWMGFDLEGYGIHGTIEPETLGQQITQGCIRMSNSDVEELFAIVSVGTEVTIVD
ncbi:MAG: L,D-transpeptidase family protein [Candidatus Omnitrophota bacterium]